MAMELTISQLDAEHAEVLPAREALSLVDLDLNLATITAINTATAVNAGNFGGSGYGGWCRPGFGGGAGSAAAWAGQNIGVWQR